MKKVAAFFHNKEVLNRILFTLAIFFVFRIGSAIVVPGVTPDESFFADTTNAFSLLNMMGGGALQNFSLFALGVSPYITSSIIIQLLSMDVLPALTQMTKEGESGRKRLNVVTRILSVVLAAVQAYGIIVALSNSGEGISLDDDTAWGYTKVIIFLVAGSMMLNWLGDQITDKGIGNGISMLIFAGIISSLPSQITGAFESFLGDSIASGTPDLILQGSVQIALYLLAFLAIIVFVTFIERSVRKLPVSHSNTSASNELASQQSSFLPIKVNASSVMPVIFASSIMVAPSIIISLFKTAETTPHWMEIVMDVFNYQAMTPLTDSFSFPFGPIIYAILIILFSYFYAQLQINPERIAENFQTSGTYITGIKPGVETEHYISKTLSRMTFMGSMALCFIALLPVILSMSGAVDASLSLGGTGLIIVVGVALEVSNQIAGILAGHGYAESEL